jgi:hypothetical protein
MADVANATPAGNLAAIDIARYWNAVLIEAPAGKLATHVFGYKGAPITQVSANAWYTAPQRAGNEDRWINGVGFSSPLLCQSRRAET